MRAIVCEGTGGPEVMKISDTVDLPQCNQNEVLLKIEATAVNRADTLQRKGKYPPPRGVTDIIGLECVGYKTDPKTLQVDKSKLFMTLLSGGGYAQQYQYSSFKIQFRYAKVHYSHLMPVPKGLVLEEIAAIPEVWLTAFQLLHKVGNGQSGETALVLAAASGVGTSLIQLAKKNKMNVIAVASNQEKLNLCKFQNILEYTNKKGVDVILDPILASNFDYNMKSIGMDSRWVMYGTMGGLKVENANFTNLILKRGQILVSTLRNRTDEYKAQLIKDFSSACIQQFEMKRLKPIVDRVMKLSEVQQAHEIIEKNQNAGKIILINDL
ncbi:zinc-binding dehydrogenase family protein [Stylonychia lemnae]|uniref:Zinc-binding dehydrogenase family protein n=1 Tax=Stylonychia lemnae TaxID=5949 RepID=A0A077ZNV1_STYLE|nr:zinc-binding dehydrogenase family protein [Stylonychia lemnae]|eukprot:CDW71149.1 zinc-binding dehydrogenase family protein [Stylonychia lemnae]